MADCNNIGKALKNPVFFFFFPSKKHMLLLLIWNEKIYHLYYRRRHCCKGRDQAVGTPMGPSSDLQKNYLIEESGIP